MPRRPTEAVHEHTRDLDQRSGLEVVRAIHDEDAVAVRAVGQVLPAVAEAVDVLACVIGGGGRWFNVGAGTSGRMGALDAAEIPPTFGLPHHRVRSVVAGGERALVRAVEGAEDDTGAADWTLREQGLCAGDAVVAISASGYTPFTLASIDVAHELGARTIAVTCDPKSPLAQAAEISISPEVGPEVIAGSTRMKGGLAQKMVLHTLSTAVMVQLGYVVGNLMANLTPTSAKLRERSLRIVMELGGVGEEMAARLLEESGGIVSDALGRLPGR